MRRRRLFYFVIHVLFLSGLFYAFGNFVTTPRSVMHLRRLWAYESWIILSFYSLFLYLTLIEREFGKVKRLVGRKMDGFKRVLMVKLILLVFPWGLFLIFAPGELLEMFRLNSVYWRILGIGSLIGAIIYYFPYRFYKYRLTYFVFIFGIIDNVLAGVIVTTLFVLGKVPLVAWSVTPLLFYYAYFFFNQVRIHAGELKQRG